MSEPPQFQAEPFGGVEDASRSLSAPSYLILVSLAARPLHGYRIMMIVNDVFRAGFKLHAGTLYRTLQRLMELGLIDEVEEYDGEDERRRAYRMTPAGHEAVRQEIRRLELLARIGKAQLTSPIS